MKIHQLAMATLLAAAGFGTGRQQAASPPPKSPKRPRGAYQPGGGPKERARRLKQMAKRQQQGETT